MKRDNSIFLQQVTECILSGLIAKEIAEKLSVPKRRVVRAFTLLPPEIRSLIVQNGVVYQSRAKAETKEMLWDSFCRDVSTILKENEKITRPEMEVLLEGMGYSKKRVGTWLAKYNKSVDPSFRKTVFGALQNEKTSRAHNQILTGREAQIEKMVDDGAVLSEISLDFSCSQYKLKSAIKKQMPETWEKIVKNTELKNRKQLAENSKKNKENGTYRKREISGEEAEYYQKRVEEGAHFSLIFREMNSLFGIAETTIKNKLVPVFGKPQKYIGSGDKDPMYGKSPSPYSGRGISGWYNKSDGQTVHFRSLLELAVFDFLDASGNKFSVPNIRIKYEHQGVVRTYVPDLIINHVVYEIKPQKLVSSGVNLAKFEAAKKFCVNVGFSFDVITEKTFPICYPTKTWIEGLENAGKIFFSGSMRERLTKSFETWRRNVHKW